MHRTTAEYFETIDTLTNQHKDKSLPGVPGTRLSAEFMNALQEEIVNVIEQAGLSIETEPAIDRSNGFAQLKVAIFDSEALGTSAIAASAITDAKVADVSFDKMTDGIVNLDKTFGANDYNWIFKYNTLKFTQEGTATGYPINFINIYANTNAIQLREATTASFYTNCGIYDDKITFSEDDGIHDEYETEIIVDQIQQTKNTTTGLLDLLTRIDPENGFYNQKSGTTIDTKWCRLDCDGLSFKDSVKSIRFTCVDFDTIWAGPGPYTCSVASIIPDDAVILSIQFSAERTSDSTVFVNGSKSPHDVTHMSASTGSGVYDINIELPSGYDPTLYHNKYATVIYTAT